MKSKALGVGDSYFLPFSPDAAVQEVISENRRNKDDTLNFEPIRLIRRGSPTNIVASLECHSELRSSATFGHANSCTNMARGLRVPHWAAVSI
jgi:hypothetical protein